MLEELEFEKGQTVEDDLEGHFKGILSGDLKKGLKTLGKAGLCVFEDVLMCECSMCNDQLM